MYNAAYIYDDLYLGENYSIMFTLSDKVGKHTHIFWKWDFFF